jgi:hypothetical protein
MAVSTGLLTSFTYTGSDISEDILSMSIGTPNNMLDVSALDLVGFQRIVGRRDCTIQLTTRLSNASPSAHSVLSPATSTSVSGACVIVFAGKTLTVNLIVGNYDYAGANDLGAIFSSTLMMANGVAAVWS